MIHSFYYTPGKPSRTQLELTEYPAAIQDQAGVFWVDFEDTPPDEDERIMREIFCFHPLAIDDALQESHVPKLDDWGEYLYIVLHSISFNADNGGDVDTKELDVFLGKNFIVTHHDKPIEAIQHLWGSIQRDERYLKNGADRLLYRLIDEIVASYMPVVEQIDEAVDRTEDEVFDKPTSRTLEHIFTLKRATLHLRRIIGPQREVLNKLARDDYAVIEARDRVYFRDVYDHLVRLYDITESIRDLVSGVLDSYLSAINNRMNDIMKTLTVITTLFMPLSFVVGFFGMNFFEPVAGLTHWTTRPAFWVTITALLAVPFGMFLWMRRRGWM